MKVFEKLEAAGLGEAPFTCIGVWSFPDRGWAEKYPDQYNRALSSMPKDFGIGFCACCGMSLNHNYLVKSADGKKFVLGSACVNKIGDGKLMTEAKATAKRHEARKNKSKKLFARAAELIAMADMIENQPVSEWLVGSHYYNSGRHFIRSPKLVSKTSRNDFFFGHWMFHPIQRLESINHTYPASHQTRTEAEEVEWANKQEAEARKEAPKWRDEAVKCEAEATKLAAGGWK